MLVDQVVQDYHAGFNKSIHNYSQILVLFTQAKEQARLLVTHALPQGHFIFCQLNYLFSQALDWRLPESRALA